MGAFERPMNREKLTTLVVVMDLFVVVLFVAYLLSIEWLIKRESKKYDHHTFTVTDYALKIKNLPAPWVWEDDY